ncbi:CAAX prenyl protease-like protein [Mucilaginibacter frigoritolerans]|uniref:CAAX prenyl protease-like protein n=1 Tax=Mucilaginibacter frigoritolerans TaxID=652788 RepID=A0A562U6J8_9SPHI|nr:type II CAAX endopeptidase family protein [Mucilaginibacter frigoritolerans]TWJ01433.1 CAAX prenyl protease-like protein [Mucilaginibacter frigoritolerans]
MNIQLTFKPLSTGKIILFTILCILIFVSVAVVCNILTSWIHFGVLKTVVRELFLKVPLTIISLHFFAGKVIKAYNPTVIYGRLRLINILKWTGISFLLPIAVLLFYYLFHFITPFNHTVSLSGSNKLFIFIKWISVSLAAGLTEEILFRGHLFMIIKSKYSTALTIFITSLIFGLVHITMLSSFDPFSICIVVLGGIIAGAMFSWIYFYTKVIWYAAITHFIWDIFFIGKIISISSTQKDANGSIWAFKLITHSFLLNSEGFGIEASMPVFVIYLTVIAMLYYLYKSRMVKKLLH